MIDDTDSEILEEVADDIHEFIEMANKRGMNRNFISGLEAARGIVTGEIQVPKGQDTTYPKLF